MYCIDETAQEPIMLINTHIGYDDEDGQGIDGAQFQRELLYLDGLGKKRIQIWINSVGGSMMEGFNIASAILNTKTPVDTYNMGMCISMAGVIFMCGRNRIMMDYSQFMMHPVQGAKDKKLNKSFTDSASSLLSAKADLTQSQVVELMNATTWMDAEDCKDKGFATEIQSAKDVNKKRLSTNNVDNFLKEANLITNKLINNKTKKSMLKVTNKLGLVEDANEDSILKAIQEIENKASDVQNKLNEDINALKETVTAKEAEITEVTNKLEAEKVVNCTNMVKSFTARIGNDEAVVNKWIDLAKADYEGTKTILEGLPINAVANKLPQTENTPDWREGGYAHERLREIANKNKN